MAFRDVPRRAAVLAAALVQIAANVGLFGAGGGFQTVRPGVDPWENAASPAGYAFLIWGLIFLSGLVYAVAQNVPSVAANAALRRSSWLAAAGFALCGVWPVFARFGPLWGTVPVIVAMLALIGAAFVIAARARHSIRGRTRLAVVAPLGVFAGWLTAAAAANFGDVLGEYGGPRLGLSIDAFGVVLIGAASCVAAWLTLAARAAPSYTLTVLWALTSIAVMNANGGSAAVFIAACAASVGVAALAASRRLHAPHARSGSASLGR